MYMSYIISNIFLLLLGCTVSTYSYSDNMNVGTVLFSQSDIGKECWEFDSLTLLSSRMVLESLLPLKEYLVVKDNSFVTDLVDYYRLLLDVIRKNTHGRVKRIMLLALTDLLGAYLQRFVLPRARDSYYAGYLSYSSMERLYKLFDELKQFLKTNGRGWANACYLRDKPLSIKSLSLHTNSETDPCSLLSLIEKTGTCAVDIPIPFTDSRTNPVAIAVPFKSHPFVGIESKAASYILVRYYITSVNCLEKRNANKSDIGNFNGALLDWMNGYVTPLLYKDKFYSAFGGVLRITETAKSQGMQAYETKMGNYNVMPELQETDVEKFEADQPSSKKRSNLILLALLSTIFLWFLLGSFFICYRFTSEKNKDNDECPCPSSKSTKSSSSNSDSKKQRSFSSPRSSSNDIKSKQSTIVCYMDDKDNFNQGRIFIKSLSGVPIASPRFISVATSDKTLTESKTYSIDHDKNKPEISSSFTVQTSFIDSSIVTSSSEETSQEHFAIEYEISSTSSETEEGK